MNPARTVPIAMLVAAVLCACAQVPAGPTANTHSLGPASAPGMAVAPAGERMAMMDAHMQSMRDMHERMMRARSPDERQAMRAEHMKMMQDGMVMMGCMGPTGESQGTKGMHGMGMTPTDLSQRQQMMKKHMEMMQSMMQMMMDQMPPAPAKP